MLEQGADPNATNIGGESGLFWASTRGHDVTAQVMLAFGADPYQATRYGDSAVTVAIRRRRDAVASLFAATENWSPLKIAVGAGLQADAEVALRLGRVGTAGDTLPSLLETALALPLLAPGLALSPTGQANARSNAGMATFVRRVMAPWSPAKHRLYHARVRSAIHIVMLVAVRHGNNSHDYDHDNHDNHGHDHANHHHGGRPAAQLPQMPPLMWRMVCSFFLRQDWLPVRTSYS